MATKKIDIIQTNQINVLEADVLELRTKLNLLVTDVQAISSKLNTLIGDLNDINNVIMAGYTVPSSPAGYGILQRIKLYKDEMDAHANLPINTTGNGGAYCGWKATHFYKVRGTPCPTFSGAPGPPPYAPGAGGVNSTPSGTGQGSNSNHSATSEDATVIGEYINRESVLSIDQKNINRARKLARKTLNSLRK